jgi:hypothetical protein
MAVKFGLVYGQQAKREKDCDFCEDKKIRPRQWYMSSVGKTKNGKFFTHNYHLDCYAMYYMGRIKERQENPKSSKPLTSRLQNFTPEQIRRRETLQTYLSSKDKRRLLKAYRLKDREKIVRAYEIIGSRWAELYQMGVPFRTTIIPRKNSEYWSDEDRELVNLMNDQDFHWVGQFSNATNVEEKMKLLFRSNEPKPQEYINPRDSMTPDELAEQEELDRIIMGRG